MCSNALFRVFSFHIFSSSDDGETFQVKKSSQSRRLMKQLKAEKKAAKRNGNGTTDIIPKAPTPPYLSTNFDQSEREMQRYANSSNPPNTKIKQGNQNKSKETQIKSWTVAGREAEALHMEEDDSSENSNDDEVKDPLQKMLQSG